MLSKILTKKKANQCWRSELESVCMLPQQEERNKCLDDDLGQPPISFQCSTYE